jgi:glycosyltransferase involved in cell wall biosynthesis
MPRALLTFEPPDGGVAVNVGHLATGLGVFGWDVELAGPEEALPYADVEAAGLPVHRLPLVRGYGSPRCDVSALRALGSLLRQGRFDLVHAHSAKAGTLGRIAARLTGVPVVYSPHCFPFIGEFRAPRRVAATIAEALLGRLGGTIICVCEDERRLGLRHRVAPPDRLVVVYNGTEPVPDDLVADPATEEFRSGGTLVAAVSVLRKQKSLETLIDAAPDILRRAPDARVAVIGHGPLLEPLRAHAMARGLQAEDRFAFVRFNPPAVAHLRAVDVYVLSSAWEAFPIGVLEAMSCGVSQVATDVGGTREAVHPDTGILVPPRDSRALADAVVQLVADPAQRTRMGARSRAVHAERFRVQRMVAETAAIYGRVVDLRGA